YDPHGREIEECVFDAAANPTKSASGYHRLTYRRDDQGNPVETCLWDEAGQRAPHVQGHARLQKTFDARGNLVKEQLFDTQGRPIVSSLGYATFTATYDRWNNRVSEAYFDAENQPMLGHAGYHLLRERFDRGVVVESRYFGLDGKPINNGSGIARITRQYDARLNMLEEATFDAAGKPVKYQGFEIETAEYDPRGNRLTTRYWNADRTPVLSDAGYFCERVVYDSLNHAIATEVFDVNDQPVLRVPEGYFKSTKQYNDQGHIIHARYFGTDNKPIRIQDGYAEFTNQYDPRGHFLSSSYYGTDGQPLRAQVTIHEVVPNTPAANLGIETGDVILRFGDHPITSAAEFNHRVKEIPLDQRILLVERDGAQLEITLPDGATGFSCQDVIPKDEGS
ncbi:MAG TPA: PDZ domain-containing protein, partial [Pirellulaceae bacterium]